MSLRQDLVPLVQAADDPWAALAALLARDASIYTDLPRGLYFAFDYRWQTDPETGASFTTDHHPARIDLGGLVRLWPKHLLEMVRVGVSVQVTAVIPSWGEPMTIERGGPLLITMAGLLAREEDCKALKLRKPKKPRSDRDEERLMQGDAALLTVRRAAELLLGDEKVQRRAISEAGIVRVIEKADGVERKKDLLGVRWGDVAALFPTEAEQVEAAQLDLEGQARRAVAAEKPRKRRPRKGGIHLADLD